MITTQEHINFESSVIYYFIWRVAKLSTVDNNNNNNDCCKPPATTPTTKVKGSTKGVNRTKQSLTTTKTKCQPQKTTTTRTNDATRGGDDDDDDDVVASSLLAEILLPKYRKVISCLQSELDFLKILDHVVIPNNDNINEPEVFSSWKQCQSNKHDDSIRKGTKDDQENISVTVDFENNNVNDNSNVSSPVCKKQKTTTTDDFVGTCTTITPIQLTNALTRRPDIPADVKQIFQAVAKETTAAKRKVASLETKLLKKAMTLETREEKLKKETETKVAKMKSKYKKKQEELHAHQMKLKEQKKREREEKKKKLEESKKKYEKWDDRYAQLLEFYKEYGHCKVTRHYKVNPSLGEWVSDQRKYYRRKASTLSQERIDKLNEIDFIWEPPSFQKTFQTRVEECKVYKEKYGHLRIPRFNEKNENGTDPTEEEKRFRLWAQSIRVQYKRRMVEKIHNKLDKLKIQALDEIGFDWDYGTSDKVELSSVVFNDRFLDRVEQLREVKRLCGTCNDKKSILKVFPNNLSLCLWVKTQRKNYRKWKEGKPSEALSEERREMLRELGFDFEPRKHYNKRASDAAQETAALPNNNNTVNDDEKDDTEPLDTTLLQDPIDFENAFV